MISASLVLIVWILFLSLLAKTPSGLPVRLIPPIAFALSKYFLFFLYLILLKYGQSASSRAVLIVLVSGALFLFVRRPINLRIAFYSIQEFIFPDVQGAAGNPTKATGLLMLRLLLTLIGICLLSVSSFLIASPQSWDSYTYNLSRILLMIFKGTPFLQDIPSIPQATFPLGHDLLFYPDLLFGNLRGLGLINTLEFIVILGCLLYLTDLMFKQKLNLESARFLSVCLFLSSDQQVLQAMSTKNDIPITTLFLTSLLVSAVWLRDRKKFSFSLLALIIFFLGFQAYTSKSYGVIVFFPLVFVFLRSYILYSRGLLKYSHASLIHQIKSSRMGQYCLLAILSYACFLFRFSAFIRFHYANLPQYKDSVGKFVNAFPSPLDYIEAAFFNFSRLLVAFFLYPYSLLLKRNPQKPDDFLISLSPIVQALNNAKGMARDYSFGLIRMRSEDHSLAGALFHFSLVLLICLLIIALIKDKTGFILYLRDKLDSKIPAMILSSSVFSGFFICAILSYHNWYAKYFGFCYVPMIPIVACLFAVTIMFLRQGLPADVGRLLMLLVPALVAFSLASILYNIGLNSRFFSLSFFPSRSGFPLLYQEYLGKRKVNGDEFFDPAYLRQGYHFTVCYGEETPSLPPLLELTRREVDRSAVSFRPLNSSQCLANPADHPKEKIILLP